MLAGCRPPAIPTEPSLDEYGVWGTALAYATRGFAGRDVLVEKESFRLDERQLGFERCLPRNMRDVFVEASPATLSSNVAEPWLAMENGRTALLGRRELWLPGSITDTYQLSRVGFSRFHRDGYVWIEHRTCAKAAGVEHCGESDGQLLRAIHHEDRWEMEETECRTLSFARDEGAAND